MSVSEMHKIDLDAAAADLRVVLSILELRQGAEVSTAKGNRPEVADVTRDLLYAMHLLDSAKVTIGEEYWSIRGRG